jgi:SAM-dependent methyltransferase
MSEMDQYVLGYGEAEQRRLQRQAEQLAPDSRWLFDQLEPLDGARVLEIGCGPSGCLDQLSRRVGTMGSVLGVERSPDAVAMAKEIVASEGLTNVEVLECDARSTGLARSSFDLVTSRLVLVNIPQPEQVIVEAVALAKPGSWVAFHESGLGLQPLRSSSCRLDRPCGSARELLQASRYRSVHRTKGAPLTSKRRDRRCRNQPPRTCLPTRSKQAQSFARPGRESQCPSRGRGLRE